jgi:glycosyltransferase involved in cell wall biosynthesis
MKVVITCDLSAPNPADFVKAIASIDTIELSVISDSKDHVNIPDLHSENIYYHIPSLTWSLNLINPIERYKCKQLINNIRPDVMISMGASDLRFISLLSGFNPTIFIPQGGETARAINDFYQEESTFNKLRSATTYRATYKKLLQHVDEVWAGKPIKPIFDKLGLSEDRFVEFDPTAAVDINKYSHCDDPAGYGYPDKTIIGTFRRPRGARILENYESFLDSIKILSAKRDDFQVVIGGLYPDRDHKRGISEQIKKRSISDKVDLLDMVPKEDMPRYLSGLDVYVNIPYPNYDFIGIGTASKEAMACKCAFMSLDMDGYPREWYLNGSGLLAKENNEQQIANAIEALINNQRNMKYSELARTLVKDRYSDNAIQSRVSELLAKFK